VVIPPHFEWALDDDLSLSAIEPRFSEGLAAVEINGKWGFLDKSGLMVIATQYDHAANFSEGLAAVQINGKWGFINKFGQMVIQPQFAAPFYFFGGLARVWVGEKWGYIDLSGKYAWGPVPKKACRLCWLDMIGYL
jgi:hypothetical protein